MAHKLLLGPWPSVLVETQQTAFTLLTPLWDGRSGREQPGRVPHGCQMRQGPSVMGKLMVSRSIIRGGRRHREWQRQRTASEGLLVVCRVALERGALLDQGRVQASKKRGQDVRMSATRADPLYCVGGTPLPTSCARSCLDSNSGAQRVVGCGCGCPSCWVGGSQRHRQRASNHGR